MLEYDLITASEEEDLICAAEYTGEEVRSGTFKVDFRQPSFTSCRFSNCDFSGSSFLHTSFTNCDFSNCCFNSCYFNTCIMSDCKGDGCDFSRSSFLSVRLEKAPTATGIFPIHSGKTLRFPSQSSTWPSSRTAN